MIVFRPFSPLVALLCFVASAAWAQGDVAPAGQADLSSSAVESGQQTAAIQWETARDGQDDVHRVRFVVADGACAYRLMSSPELLVANFRHVYGAEMHETRPSFQDVTFSERFFLVARGHSRYHRTLFEAERVEWRLIDGRQAVHDGYWQLRPLAGSEGRTAVIFENRIRARKRLHQGMLRGIQRRTMGDIVEVTQALCGAG